MTKQKTVVTAKAFRAEISTLKKELTARDKQLKKFIKEVEKTLIEECNQAYEEGYDDALSDQSSFDEAYEAHMQAASIAFEKALLAKITSKKKTPTKSRSKAKKKSQPRAKKTKKTK